MLKAGHILPQIICKVVYGLYSCRGIPCYKATDDVQRIEEEVRLDLAQHNLHLCILNLSVCLLLIGYGS